MKQFLIFLFASLAATAVAQGNVRSVQIAPFGTTVDVRSHPSQGQVVVLPYGTVQYSSIWQRKRIAVCWENPGAAVPAHLVLVRNAVTSTWERESQLSFHGWGPCTPASRGIRIQVGDTGPHVKALGRYLDGRPEGMVLNFAFERWSPECQTKRDFCIWALAVHEFGHAIGFAHEQNRPDAPFECRAESQGTDGDWNVTSYDPASVMNYCNLAWNNDGKLSERDIDAVRRIYGKRS